MRELLLWLDPDSSGFWRRDFPPLGRIYIAAGALVLFAFANELRSAFWLVGNVDLVIHEAGHPIFSVLGLGHRLIKFIGGTAMQLLIHSAFVVTCFRQHQLKSSDVCLLWFGQNFLHIAPYVADARAQELPLVGGGEHDWNYLLGVFGLLEHDRGLSHLCDLTGCLVIAVACYSLYRRFAPPAAPSPEAG
jgi:hypothetical protein